MTNASKAVVLSKITDWATDHGFHELMEAAEIAFSDVWGELTADEREEVRLEQEESEFDVEEWMAKE